MTVHAPVNPPGISAYETLHAKVVPEYEHCVSGNRLRVLREAWQHEAVLAADMRVAMESIDLCVNLIADYQRQTSQEDLACLPRRVGQNAVPRSQLGESRAVSLLEAAGDGFERDAALFIR